MIKNLDKAIKSKPPLPSKSVTAMKNPSISKEKNDSVTNQKKDKEVQKEIVDETDLDVSEVINKTEVDHLKEVNKTLNNSTVLKPTTERTTASPIM